jgi:hypothetical protein
VRTYAEQLGYNDQAKLLQQTLDEEGHANELLTEIAESSVNIEAEQGSDEEEMTSSRGSRSDRPVSRNVSMEGGRTRSTTSGSRAGRGTTKRTSSRSSQARAR